MTVSTSTFTTSGFNDGLKKDLDTVFERSMDLEEKQYPKIFQMLTTEDAYEDDVQIQYPEEIARSVEGGMYNRVDIENVRRKRYTVFTYKGEGKITMEALADLKYNEMTNMAKGLGIAGNRTVESECAGWLYNGFTSEQSPDGLSVFNTAHTLSNPSAGRPTTCSNRGTAALAASSLKAGRTSMRKQLDEHGRPSRALAKQLIIPPDLDWLAQQLLVPSARGEAGTANNDASVAGNGLTPVILDFLQEAASNAGTQWFLRDPQIAMNKFYWRQKPKSEVVREESTGDYLYRITFRYALGCSDWRGLYGSTGAV